MSTNLHLHGSDDNHIGDVCVPGAMVYQPCLHRVGAHTYDRLGETSETLQEAMHRLTDALVADKFRTYNRGGVWGVEVEPSYYGPVMLFEVRRA